MITERRATQGLELRTEGDMYVLRGYAAKFNVASRDLGGFVEIVRPGAFRQWLDSKNEVVALAHHRPEMPLARRSAGSLKIEEDEIGLAYEMRMVGTTHALDLIKDVQAGNVDAMSFGFRKNRDNFIKSAGQPVVRELLQVEVHEISPVAFPAYPDTSVALRSLDEALRDATVIFAATDTELRDRLSRARLRLLALPA